jgi:hypothetical protein
MGSFFINFAIGYHKNIAQRKTMRIPIVTVFLYIILLTPTIHPFQIPSFLNIFEKQEKKTYKKDFNVTKKTTFNVTAITGDITIQTWDKDTVLIEIEKQAPEGQMDAISVPITHTASTLNVQTKHEPIPYEPKKKSKQIKQTPEQFTPPEQKLIVNYTIIMPTYLASNIHVKYGTIAAHSTSGPLSLKTKHGDITASDAYDIQAETEKGAITLEDIQNELFAKTDNGSITLQSIQGALAITEKGNITIDQTKKPINVRSNSGHISIKNSKHDIKAEAINGSIQIEHAAKNVFANAEKGGVTLKKASLAPEDSIFIQAKRGVKCYIHPKFSANLYAKTVYGSVLSNADVTLDQITTKLNKETWNFLKKNIKGTIGGGGGPVTIDTTSGDIELIQE